MFITFQFIELNRSWCSRIKIKASVQGVQDLLAKELLDAFPEILHNLYFVLLLQKINKRHLFVLLNTGFGK